MSGSNHRRLLSFGLCPPLPPPLSLPISDRRRFPLIFWYARLCCLRRRPDLLQIDVLSRLDLRLLLLLLSRLRGAVLPPVVLELRPLRPDGPLGCTPAEPDTPRIIAGAERSVYLGNEWGDGGMETTLGVVQGGVAEFVLFRGEGGGALYCGGKLDPLRELSSVLTTPPARHSRTSRCEWGASSGGEGTGGGWLRGYSGGLVCSPVEMGNGADVSRYHTFHPLPLAQTKSCESTLQLVAVATHHSTAPAISMRVTPPPSPLSGPG